MSVYNVTPIGIFHSSEKYAYDVPRQGVLAAENRGRIVLDKDLNLQQATYKLDTFSHIWVLFIFDRNSDWKPMVLPPRHLKRKVGVLASRAPYRPNMIGMSCVKLLAVNGLTIEIGDHDLLDGTPVIDIKPYLPYADAFPLASPGWTAEGDEHPFTIAYSDRAQTQVEWLSRQGVPCLSQFIQDRLSNAPLDAKRNRLLPDIQDWHVLAYRTWRILFSVAGNAVLVHEIRSGYPADELNSPEDKYADKAIHRAFANL